MAFVLWRSKPAAVLGNADTWIPKQEIQGRLNEVRIFNSAGEARHIQRSQYAKKGVSVLGEKTFKEKTGIKKLPVRKEAASPPSREGEEPAAPVTYSEYLDVLCEGDCGQGTRVIFPPANYEQTTQTPLIQEIQTTLAQLEGHLAKAESQEQRLHNEIKQLDLLISDRLHQAELFDLTPEECTIFVQGLRETQVERRRRKNELAALLTCKELLRQVPLPEVKRAIREVEALGRQGYRCHVLTESDPFVQEYVTQKGGKVCD